MKKDLNNIALCYHKITSDINEKSAYTTYLEDFKGQILHLESLGYKFVKPSDFYVWYDKISPPPAPLATVIFDDAMESIGPATIWLAGKTIPFGIAVIGQRLGKLTPEEGYASWKDLNTAVESELCELLLHTYDLHHFCLINDHGKIVSAPVLEAPCFVDRGEFVYISPEDTRWYWDMSHVNKTAWGFPLFGTDTQTGKTITSVIKFKAHSDIEVEKIRVWSCLHKPSGSGYAAEVQIIIDNTVVADDVINTVTYENGSQWPEREFVSIPLKNKFLIHAGKSYTMQFITKNTGNAAFMIYTIPEFSGNYELTTTCTEMTFPEGISWPARACIILADNKGKTVSVKDFQTYVNSDLVQNKRAVLRYLNTEWNVHSMGFKESDLLDALVLGGTYSNGQTADTKIELYADKSFTAEVLRFKYASRLGSRYPLMMDILINEVKVGRFEANWWDWHWQSVEIAPFDFTAGNVYTIRFKTKNKSPFGQGLVRVYMEQPKPPQPEWNREQKKIIVPSDANFSHDAFYEVSSPEGTDVYPDGAYLEDTKFHWIVNPPYDGPGKVLLEVLSCLPNATRIPTQICYPFGSYYPTKINSKLVPEKEDIHPDLKAVLMKNELNSGYSIWDNPVSSFKKINLKYSGFIIPRYLIKGNMEQSKVIQNINIFIGNK